MARGARLLLVLALLAALLAVVLQLYRLRKPKLWTVEELSVYNGTDEGLPILLGILGSVFDVTKGMSHYGPGGGYHHFAGSTIMTGMRHERLFLETLQVTASLILYRVCQAVSQGNPTKYLKGVEVKAKRGAQLLEKQKSEEDKIPSCNSKWSQQEGGEVWCDSGYPRLVRRPGDIALTGQVSQRCACFQEDELNKPGLVAYEGCDHLSKSCKVN
ncbi:unnamed protein product [Urochloa decumbens]|uniref:Cytochrome b5 heme-binding domain-containing protein n=1 Tax=Urochloa decumbens TaxID=240449 RepID=A0ABC8WNV7_9POAL